MKALITFLEEQVNGRILHTAPLRYTLDNGALEGEYADQITFSRLLYSETLCQLDMFVVSQEQIYRPGEAGRGRSLEHDYSGASLFRYELAKRKSTGEITGHFRFISATRNDVPADATVSGIYGLRLEDGCLRMQEDQCLYRDQPDGNGYKPLAFTAEHEFALRDGKLHYTYTGQNFAVDPVTLARSASVDEYPAFQAVEK